MLNGGGARQLMTIEIASYSFTLYQLALLGLAAALIGMAKTGVHGAGMISVPLLALVFGAKASTGIALPILILADLFAVYYYHQHASWAHLRKLIPFAFLGIVVGTVVGQLIDELMFAYVMIAIIFVSLAVMIYRERRTDLDIPSSPMFSVSIGVAGGFATMVGNLAGPVMALYLLAMRLPKDQFIGTAAWFFLLVNIAKLPFHIWVWETITWNSSMVNLVVFPAIALGAFLGFKIVSRIPEKPFRWFVIIMTAVSAIAMLI